QIRETHSIAAGLDYPGVGPEHSQFLDSGRVEYLAVTDQEALAAFSRLAEWEGIIPALESAHAVAQAIRMAPSMNGESVLILCLSGRGDKDVEEVRRQTNEP
ncbi:MAG TPA: pyridoxal-phosphate dependent enzyme, partial [Atribacteraceae bacterium]|nr:pyridoxal-phosphate dependent enzyme [Atribacteraceae bacterium]